MASAGRNVHRDARYNTPMRRHWIIRASFIALLLLLLGSWGCSHIWEINAFYQGKYNDSLVGFTWGHIRLFWRERDPSRLIIGAGWTVHVRSAENAITGMDYFFAGFSWTHHSGFWQVSVPFWFLTGVAA